MADGRRLGSHEVGRRAVLVVQSALHVPHGDAVCDEGPDVANDTSWSGMVWAPEPSNVRANASASLARRWSRCRWRTSAGSARCVANRGSCSQASMKAARPSSRRRRAFSALRRAISSRSAGDAGPKPALSKTSMLKGSEDAGGSPAHAWQAAASARRPPMEYPTTTGARPPLSCCTWRRKASRASRNRLQGVGSGILGTFAFALAHEVERMHRTLASQTRRHFVPHIRALREPVQQHEGVWNARSREAVAREEGSARREMALGRAPALAREASFAPSQRTAR